MGQWSPHFQTSYRDWQQTVSRNLAKHVWPHFSPQSERLASFSHKDRRWLCLERRKIKRVRACGSATWCREPLTCPDSPPGVEAAQCAVEASGRRTGGRSWAHKAPDTTRRWRRRRTRRHFRRRSAGDAPTTQLRGWRGRRGGG